MAKTIGDALIDMVEALSLLQVSIRDLGDAYEAADSQDQQSARQHLALMRAAVLKLVATIDRTIN